MVLQLLGRYEDRRAIARGRQSPGEERQRHDRQGSSGCAGCVSLPQRYALSQNVPNPFNPSTTIRFDLPEESHVRLAVYDADGRQVVELVSGTRPAGRYQEVWQGRDASGRAVSSGVYFAHIEAASVSSAERLSSTRKMLLLQ